MKGSIVLYVGVLFTLMSCDGGSDMRASTIDARTAFGDVTPQEWEALSQRRIFFGHQSVGGNILDGVRRIISENPQIDLRLVQSASPSSVSGPALIETFIGTNGDPASKSANFQTILESGIGGESGIAMYKFCYLDVNASTDVEKMFADYRASVENVRSKDPTLTIVHFTLPLTTVEGPAIRLVKRLMGRGSQLDINVKRNQFNALLLAEYGGKEPVFDLARIESTRPDGDRSYLVREDEPVYVLASELTDDGGHLNELGQRIAAEEYLAFLARLPS
jgi:hypothetical protein